MLNNYLQEYKSYHHIYRHETQNSIYLGDIGAALDNQFINRQNIRTVITTASNMEHINYHSNINHIVYNLLDSKYQNLLKLFNKFYLLIQQHIIKGNVLVHCAAGISRSPTLVISYLMKKKSWTFKKAIHFVRQSRPNVCPNLGFERQLKEYQTILTKKPGSSQVERIHISKNNQPRRHGGTPQIYQLPQIALGMTQLRTRIQLPNFHKKTLEIKQKTSKMVRQMNRQGQSYQSGQMNRYRNGLMSKRSNSNAQKNLRIQQRFNKIQELVATKLKLNQKRHLQRNIRRPQRLALYY